MSAPLHRSLRALANDQASGPLWWLFVATCLIALWVVWMFVARVPVYALSDTSRIEVALDVHSVQSPVQGKVASSNLILDRWVEAGEVIVQLDATKLELELTAKQALVENLSAQIGPIQVEVGAKTTTLNLLGNVIQTQVAEARARYRGGVALAQSAREEAERSAQLRDRAILSESEFSRLHTEGEVTLASAQALEMAITRIEAEGRLRRSELDAELAGLKRELDQIEGRRTQEQLAIESLRYEIDLRSIRAPVSGNLGEVVRVHVGSVVETGDRMGVVVPPGSLQVTADFPPDVALGRVRHGQPAQLRLNGFPWMEFGTLSLVVNSVGSEVSNGTISVQLEIVGDVPPRIPMQHGLPGSVEVEVERVSPAELALRAAGRALERPKTSARASNDRP